MKQTKGPSDPLLCIQFDNDHKTLIGAAKGNLYFFYDGTKGVTTRTATGWGSKTSLRQTTLSIGFLKYDTIVGCLDGKLLRLKGSNIVAKIDGHKSAVNSLFTRSQDKGVISGGADAVIIVWNEKMEKERTIEVRSTSEFTIINPRVRSVCETADRTMIAYSTRSSNVVEVDLKGNTKQVNSGHSDRELWGLAVQPNSDYFYTCGEDYLLAKWSFSQRKQVLIQKLQFEAKVAAVSPDSKYLAVGCCNGHAIIFNTEDLTVKQKIADRSKEISEIKFSPNNLILAVGGHDNRIKIYNTQTWKLQGECKGHQSTVTHFDFSMDSKVLQSNCTSYELLYWDTSNGAQIQKGASLYRDEKWFTWSLTIGWPVQGIYPACSDGTDINAVCRSKDSTIIATGDDFGKVRLFKYPCPIKESSSNCFAGHSSHVTCVKFSPNDDYLLSTGGNDKAIFQWRYISSGVDECKDFIDDDFDAGLWETKKFKKIRDGLLNKVFGKTNALAGGLFETEDVDGGDQSSGMKPYEQEIKALIPSNFKKKAKCSEPPEGNLFLKRVFGYRSYDTKDSAFFLNDSNNIVWIAATLGVVMNLKSKEQKFFNEHEDDVLTIDITRDKKYIATASVPKPESDIITDIYVWDTENMNIEAHLTGFHNDGIKTLKFSPKGDLLATVGTDIDNSIAVYDWSHERLLSTSKVDKEPVYDLDWLDEEKFVSVGKSHIKFWECKANSVVAMKGLWGAVQAVPLTSCVYAGTFCVTGSSKGDLIVWEGTNYTSSIQGHQGVIYVLRYNKETEEVISGGADGLVKSWKFQGKKLVQGKLIYDAKTETSFGTEIKVIDFHEDGSYLIGTRNGDLNTIDPKGETGNVLMGHYDKELNGLACDPTGVKFVTCGEDKTVRIWDILEKDIVGLYLSERECYSVDWSVDGKQIVVAGSGGLIQLFDSELDIKSHLNSTFINPDDKIDELKFSPCGKYIAMGNSKKISPIEIMAIQNEKLVSLSVIKTGFTAGLCHLDWSANSNFIRVNSVNAELKFIDVAKGGNAKTALMKDTVWFTGTSKFEFGTQGIFATEDPNDVTSVCKAKNNEYLATSDTNQYVNLFRYPSTEPKSGCKIYVAHSSPVSKARFSMNDNVLVTIGCLDKTVIVWGTDFGGDHPEKEKFLGVNDSTNQ